MENMAIHLAFDPIDKVKAGVLADFLNENGFLVKSDGTFEKDGILGLVMSKKSNLAALMRANPWIAEEFKRSTMVGLRVLPLVIYDSSLEKLKDVWVNAEKIYAIMSEEFKPFAYDLNNPEKSLSEFKRIIAEGYTE